MTRLAMKELRVKRSNELDHSLSPFSVFFRAQLRSKYPSSLFREEDWLLGAVKLYCSDFYGKSNSIKSNDLLLTNLVEMLNSEREPTDDILDDLGLYEEIIEKPCMKTVKVKIYRHKDSKLELY